MGALWCFKKVVMIGILESKEFNTGPTLRDSMVLYSKLNSLTGVVLTDELGLHNGATNNEIVKGFTGIREYAVKKFPTNPFSWGDHIDFAPTDGLSNNVSVSGSMWIKFSTVAPSWLLTTRRIGYYGWQVCYYLDKLRVEFYNTDNSSISIQIPWTPVIDTWYHIGWTLDPTLPSNESIKAYLQGLRFGDSSHSVGTLKTMYTNQSPLVFGILGGTTDFNYDGLLDELGVWKNRVLTDADFLKIWDSGNAFEM